MRGRKALDPVSRRAHTPHMVLVTGLRRRGPGDRRLDVFIWAGLTAFVGATYFVVVLGVGALTGNSGEPNVGLAVIATAIVALGFEPVRRRLDRLANRALHGRAPSPYDVLRQFSDAATGQYEAGEIPVRMAKLLAEATGARCAQVWLVVAGRLSLSASWPAAEATIVESPEPAADARDASGGHRRALAVHHDGELLGVLRVEERADRPLTPVEERLFAGLAAQAGLVLRALGLRAELSHRLAELSARAEELRRSRIRLIAAHDDERSKLERDIHDGAQQHLVALTVNLRLALTLMVKSPTRAARLLDQQASAAQTAIETLEQLAHGIYPSRLVNAGLAPALRVATADGPLNVVVTETSTRRPTPEVEAALYFCCMEALQNAAKHADATEANVELNVAADGRVQLTVEDDGCGFEPSELQMGAGLANMHDRIGAIDGHLVVQSAPRHGARLDIYIPALLPAATAS
jgi:signal transduction histidine kinase